MRRVKYALHPGSVESRSDGDFHFISAGQLAELYGIRPKDYIIWDNNKPECMLGYNYDDYIHLYPRYDGNYKKVEQQ